MRRYYEGHEVIYQRLDADGADCWGYEEGRGERSRRESGNGGATGDDKKGS